MNWVAIIVAVVVNIALGFLWFSPMLFVKAVDGDAARQDAADR